jgi:hypothetical protein
MQIIARSNFRPLLSDEIKSEVKKDDRQRFDALVHSKYGDYDPELINVFDNEFMYEPITYETPGGVGDTRPNNDINNDGDRDESHPNTGNSKTDEPVRGPDPLQGSQVTLPKGDRNEIGTIIGRKWNADGNCIGRPHKNPILDSRVYVVKFNDEKKKIFRTM